MSLQLSTTVKAAREIETIVNKQLRINAKVMDLWQIRLLALDLSYAGCYNVASPQPSPPSSGNLISTFSNITMQLLQVFQNKTSASTIRIAFVNSKPLCEHVSVCVHTHTQTLAWKLAAMLLKGFHSLNNLPRTQKHSSKSIKWIEKARKWEREVCVPISTWQEWLVRVQSGSEGW